MMAGEDAAYGDTPKQPLLVDGDNNVVYRQAGGNVS